MESASAIWTHFRLRALDTPLIILAISMLALSLAGRAQQAPPATQKHQAATRHIGGVEYRNTKYGFTFTLPQSWTGYRVLWSEWEGRVLASSGTEEHVLRGPKLSIRHPKWTEENPWEDMPIMIFTIAQWNEAPIVSAAPFGPAELGRNRKYVFAVPPRWEYDFSEGYEEAEKILAPASLHTFAPEK